MKTRKLKILLISKTLPWQFKGGIQTHVWELGRSLILKGHDVSILFGGPYRSKMNREQKEGIEMISLPYFPGRYLKPISLMAEEFSFNWSVYNWVKKNHLSFDIIHAQGRSGYLLSYSTTVSQKLVNTVHGLIDIENRGKKWYNFNHNLHHLLTKKFEHKLYNNSFQLIAVSKSLKEDIATRTSNNNIEVVSNGVRASNKDVSYPSSGGKFLFVGRLHPVKGIKKIVENMDLSSPGVFLDIIGDGSQRAEINKIIHQKGLQQKVKLLGEMENEKVQELLPLYSGLILPSQYETQGIVLLEANAHAIPVIASDLPAIRETIENGHNGILCPEGDAHSFIQVMNFLTEQIDKAHEMGLNGKVKVEASFTWDKIAEQTENLYYSIAQ